MSAISSIEWTTSTWNPIRAYNIGTGKIGWHCEHASEGCRFCYAEGINRRLGTGLPFKPGHLGKDIEIFLDDKMLTAPLRWRMARKIFVGSMTDLFADFVTDEMIVRVLDIVRRTSCDGGSNCGKIKGQHVYQVLTKRPARMAAFMPRLRFDDKIGLYLADDGKRPVVMKNLWLGTSCENQETADERIPHLLQTPAAVRFVSLEPLLGAIELWREDKEEGALRGCGVVVSGGVTIGTPHGPPEGYDNSYPGLDWVIIGGESGPHARPFNIEWADSLVAQCAAANVPCFLKQLGACAMSSGYPMELSSSKGGDWDEWPDSLKVRQFPS